MFISRFGARFLCAVAAACSLGFAMPADVRAEGFAVMENSARGMSLSGGLVARGDDTSVVAYNPAAITRLPGTQMQANLAISMFYWGIDTRDGAGNQTNYHCAHQTWPLPAFYVTHQLNDKWWFGFGSYTRFGLGTKYPSQWAGGVNLKHVQLITQSYTPTIAYKINDMFSVSASAEIMWATMQMNKNLGVNPMLGMFGAHDLNINGHGVSFGGSLAVHAKLNEQWSMGLTYRAPMSLKVQGKARYDAELGKNPMLASLSPTLAAMQNSKLRGTMHLPDSFTFGVAWKPTEKLSFEADAQYTLWSRFRDFNMYMKSP
ncbi:MAG: outer membrane protein transport protein, partial [Mailhella sp.]|nr:outer membrane protein transport protein [Mailhella sp.]